MPPARRSREKTQHSRQCSKRDWMPPVLVPPLAQGPGPRQASARGLRKGPELGQDGKAKPSGHPRQGDGGSEATQSSGCLRGQWSALEGSALPGASPHPPAPQHSPLISSFLSLFPGKQRLGGTLRLKDRTTTWKQKEDQHRPQQRTCIGIISCNKRLSPKLIRTAETPFTNTWG